MADPIATYPTVQAWLAAGRPGGAYVPPRCGYCGLRHSVSLLCMSPRP